MRLLFDVLFLTCADTFFLILIAVIGITVSFEDIKFGRVRNKLIMQGLIAGLIGYLSLFVFALLSHRLKMVYFRDVLRNITISWTIAYLVWYAGLWSAGDAKLYMLFSFLVPLEYYGIHKPIFFFPSFVLIVNAFIFVLAFVLVDTIARMTMLIPAYIFNFHKHRQGIADKIVALKARVGQLKADKAGLLKVFLAYLSIFMAMNIAMMHLEYFKVELIRNFPALAPYKDFSFILFILLFRPLNKFIREVKLKTLYFVCGFLLAYTLVLLALYSQVYLLRLTRMFAYFTGFMIFIVLFIDVIGLYIEKKEEVETDIANLNPGMRLTSFFAAKLNAHLKEQGRAEKLYSDGLTAQQIELVREASLTKPEFARVSVYKFFPLAPFIFLGVALTVIKRGSIFDFSSFGNVFTIIINRLF